jgi:hypothetical protein
MPRRPEPRRRAEGGKGTGVPGMGSDPKEKPTLLTVVAAVTPGTFRVNVTVSARKGLCALLPAIEPFASSYLPSAEAGPMMVCAGPACPAPERTHLLLFLETYQLPENSTYPLHIDTLSPSSEAPSCRGQDNLFLDKHSPVQILKSSLEFFLVR